MSIANSDIIVYGAANIAEDDVSTQGGAIATTIRYVFSDSTLANTLAETVEVLSSNVGDTTQTVTVYGRNAAGSLINEVFNLAGTTVQNGGTTFQTINKIVINASHAGTVTVRKASDNTAIAALETGVLQVRRLWIGIAADASGGSSRAFYEKIFIKNTHASLNYLSTVISEITDTPAVITFDLEDAVNDNNSTASRLNTAPTGMLGSFDSAAKNCPGTDLAFGSAIGVWLKITLPAGNAAILDTYVLRAAGTST